MLASSGFAESASPFQSARTRPVSRQKHPLDGPYLNTAGTEDRTGSSRPDAAVTRRHTGEGVPFATTDDVDFERERLPDRTIRYALNRLEEDLVDFRYSFHDVRRQVFLVNYSRIRNRLHSRSHAAVRSYSVSSFKSYQSHAPGSAPRVS